MPLCPTGPAVQPASTVKIHGGLYGLETDHATQIHTLPHFITQFWQNARSTVYTVQPDCPLLYIQWDRIVAPWQY